NLRTGEFGFIRPENPRDDWIAWNWQVPATLAAVNLAKVPLTVTYDPRTVRKLPRYRWNWNTPYILSSHNPRIFYAAGNYVFRSVNRGRELRVISPEITRTKRGSGTALAESPRNADILWVGADDGALWVTRDGGKQWTNVMEKVGLPGPRWVATIEPSRFAE